MIAFLPEGCFLNDGGADLAEARSARLVSNPMLRQDQTIRRLRVVRRRTVTVGLVGRALARIRFLLVLTGLVGLVLTRIAVLVLVTVLHNSSPFEGWMRNQRLVK
jgi:hypothetical protein